MKDQSKDDRKQTPKGREYSIKPLPADHPIYTTGFVVGGKRLKDSLENTQEDNLKTESQKPEEEDKNMPKVDEKELSPLEKSLRRLGSKRVPHPGGFKVRIFPQPKK